MTSRRPSWRTYVLFGVFLLGGLSVAPMSAEAQSGRRPGSGLPDDIDKPLDDDPTDPKKREAAILRKAQRYMEEGQKLIAKGKFRRARAKFKAVIGLVGMKGPGQAALGELMAIHNQGMEALNKAKALYEEKQYREALKQAKECKVQYANIFSGLKLESIPPNVSRLAAQLIKKIELDPEALMAIQEYEAAKRARRLPKLEKRAEKDPLKYYEIYKITSKVAKHFPDCPTGKRCAERITELKKNKKIWKIIKVEERRRQISSMLDTIRTYERAGLKEEAQEAWRKLQKKYPGKTRKEYEKIAKGK